MTDIIPYLSQPDVLDQIAKQIAKDFTMAGLSINISPPVTSYQELVGLVKPHVDQLLNNNSEKLLPLLYRIDLQEELVKKALAEAPEQTPSQILTHIILKREVQKVVLRKIHSK